MQGLGLRISGSGGILNPKSLVRVGHGLGLIAVSGL